ERHVAKGKRFVSHKDKNKLVQVERKWRDESYTALHWGKTPDELRFARRDRLQRNLEFCMFNPTGLTCKCLFLEGFDNSSITTQPVRYVDETDEMIWWSERGGWGHFYLYGRDGTYKNAIT